MFFLTSCPIHIIFRKRAIPNSHSKENDGVKNMTDSNFIRLTVSVLPYLYGKKGTDSLAARFATATPENNFKIDEDQPYGEVSIQ